MKNVRITLTLAGAVVVGTVAWGALTAYELEVAQGPTEAMVLFDPHNDLEVAGSADDVFHGTVLERTGRETLHFPSDVYRVKVGETFKGRLSGTIKVSQAIGDRPALAPGAKYVFTTAAFADRSAHAVLMEVVLREAPDLDAVPPADRPAARDTRTVRDYWRWVIAHEVDVSAQPSEAG